MGIFDQNNSNQPANRFGGRILIAIIIGIVGLFMYLSQSQENPVTGKKQHVSLNPNQEIRLGLESAPKMAHEMGGELPATDPRVQLVQKMGQLLVANTEAKKSPWKFQFHVLADTKTVNAFALPGGQIFITLGLLNKLKTEAQLAGVLSHEMGHVIERHTAQQMAKSQFGQLLVLAVGVGASDSQHGMNDPMVIASVVNQMTQLRYGRKDELEADLWGLRLMHEVGYDPRAMIQVMEILKGTSGGGSRSLDFFQTHPDPDKRIDAIKAYLKEHPSDENTNEGENLNISTEPPSLTSPLQKFQW